MEIRPEARGAWRSLEASLRPFIARRVASPADVDDVLQETFARLHRGAAGLRDGELFGPWVYRVARSAIADHRRACARHPHRDAPAEELPAEPEEERVFACRVDEQIGLLIELLPEPTRATLRATELEGRSQAEVARAMGVPLTTVRSRVQRGRARLREMVEALCAVTLDARGRLVACDPREGGCCGSIPVADPPRGEVFTPAAARGDAPRGTRG